MKEKKLNKKIPIIGLIFVSFVFLNILFANTIKVKNINLSEFIKHIEKGNLNNVIITNQGATFDLDADKGLKTEFPQFYSPKIIDKLTEKNIEFKFISPEQQEGTFSKVIGGIIGLISWLPMLIITFIMLAPFIKFKKGKKDGENSGIGGGLFSNPFQFGKSKAKAIMPQDLKVKFSDVQGIDEAKEEIEEVVDFLKSPLKYHTIGGKIPRGCLLIGQPGTGKTMLAKAIAAEANVPFFSISGSDFVEMFVGVGASRVRDMFLQAKKYAPCIVFIDEIDAVGRHRGHGIGGGNDEREQTLNQLLVEMDGFEENQGIVVVAATNRPDVLDPALLRPGRFDRQIPINLPDINGREKILKIHSSKVKMESGIDLRSIARGTPGFSGADLANIINEAAIMSAKKGMKTVTQHILEEAKDKVIMGSERKSMIMKTEEKKLTAYHEGGHAIVSLHMKGSDPIHKATIIPRGRALGMVVRLPEEDRFSVTHQKLIADLAVAMGGRVAEELIFGQDYITTGASSDIQQATNMARSMVTKWGFSKKLGKVNYSGKESNQYLGGSEESSSFISDESKKIIDTEVKEIIEEAYTKAKQILTKHANELELLAQSLLEHETLTGEEINSLLKDGKLEKKKTIVQKKSPKTRIGKIITPSDKDKNQNNDK